MLRNVVLLLALQGLACGATANPSTCAFDSSLLQVKSALTLVDEPEPQRPAMTTLPNEGDLSPSEMQQFWADVDELQEGAMVASPDQQFESFPVDEALARLHVNTTRVTPELQGVWWLQDHPTMGPSLLTMYGADKVFEGNIDTDPPESGFVYASLIRSRGMAAPDTGANRSRLSWFRKKGLEFAFPRFNKSLVHGDHTYFNVHLDGIFRSHPIPAAIFEGWTFIRQVRWLAHPDAKTDPAQCFCSAIYSGENEITRNNFGSIAYKFHRVMDGTGANTPLWAKFKSEMNRRGITRMVTLVN